MLKIFCIFCLSFFLLACSDLSRKKDFQTLQIAGETFELEVADSVAERAMGLSVRSEIAENGGMIFVFENPEKHKFWMKDTRFPITIFWISADKKIVDVQKMPPCEKDPCPAFSPAQKAKWVVEIRGSFFEKMRGMVGKKLDF